MEVGNTILEREGVMAALMAMAAVGWPALMVAAMPDAATEMASASAPAAVVAACPVIVKARL